jgi:hypothetical protein
MDKIGNAVTAFSKQQRSLTTNTRSESERLKRERELNLMLTKALVTSADFGKVTALQMSALVAYLDTLESALVDRLLSVTEGIQTVTKYVPSIAELAAHKATLEANVLQFRPHTTWKRAEIPRGPWDEETDYERKRRIVREALGYDPNQRTAPKRDLVRPTDDEVSKAAAGLKTPERPISPQLRAKLEAEGWPFIPVA